MSDTTTVRIIQPDHAGNRVAIWGAVVVSTIVLCGFIAVSVLLFTRSIPAESKEIALLMFGGLNSMASAVVGFWVGSSMSSSRKDAVISQLSNK